MNKLILAIDFDGVIHDYKHPIIGRRMGAPIEGAKEYINNLKLQGHTIIVHSVWGGNKKVIEDWMKYYGIMFDDITNIKPNADYFIDDKAIRFESWQQVMACLTLLD